MKHRTIFFKGIHITEMKNYFNEKLYDHFHQSCIYTDTHAFESYLIIPSKKYFLKIHHTLRSFNHTVNKYSF